MPVGTCDQEGWVHSPVRGRHPNLEEGLKTFIKHFAGERAALAAEHWPGESIVHRSARDTEAGKLLELAQFGLQVRVCQSIYEWCDAQDVDPSVAYSWMASTYNLGYEDLGDDHFIRPVLSHVPGDIGGHCVVQNMELLDHPIAKLMEEGL